MKVEKESGESQRIRSQLAGLCRRGGLAFLSKSSKPVGASTVDSSSEDSDSEEKNKPKPKSKANSKGKATPKTAAKPKVPQKRKELIEKKSSEGRRRWKTEAAKPTAEPAKRKEAAKASEPSPNPDRNPADKAERGKGSKQVEKLKAKPAEKPAANSEKNEEKKTENLSAEKPESIQTEKSEKDSAEKRKKDSAVNPDDYSASMHATHSSVPTHLLSSPTLPPHPPYFPPNRSPFAALRFPQFRSSSPRLLLSAPLPGAPPSLKLQAARKLASLYFRVLRTPQASPAHPRRRGLHRRRLRCLPATRPGQIETLDASLASPSLRFRHFIARLWISDSDSDDPGLLAVQQALTSESLWHSSSPALLLQQKKEKKRLVQQNRRQRANSVPEGAQKIVRAWEAQLEGF